MTETRREPNERSRDFLNEFKKSLEFDRRLFFADIRISISYCSVLFHAGILTRIEAERIRNGLQTVLKRADFNRNYFDESSAPDVHSFVEERLVQLIGDSGAKINVGRTRSEQTVTAFRLWLREETEELSKIVKDLQSVLIKSGENQSQAVLPVYTHSKKSQTILWAHWCLAYFEMFARDRERLDEAWRRINVLPLGAANLAGTSLEIDREEIARELGFEGVSNNSLDAVTDADFTIEFGGACSLLAIHLSRLAADLILYELEEFGFINLPRTFSNDSFPAVKNLEVLEIVQGKTSRICANQTTLVSVIKNLPLGIHSNFSEAMQTVFDIVETLKSCLKTTRIVLENIRVNEQKTRSASNSEFQISSELSDYLTHRGLSPKTAKDVAGKIFNLANSKNKKIDELSLVEMQHFSAVINEDVYETLNLEQSLAVKNQIGGTAPERVSEALEAAKESLEREES
jgi:argininosuccinate lyase